MSEPLAPLHRDVGCRKNMMWATGLDPSIAIDDFQASLKQHGFIEGRGGIADKLSVYDHGSTGHRVVFVHRSGRIQIRLDALTRHEDRVAAAKEVYDVLLAATQAAARNSNEATA